uniref:Helicase ARIP4 n=1 Tax=Bursaphelenchus xylophilus TaxID=6326 RepID=A0A1I7SUE6_BURXY
MRQLDVDVTHKIRVDFSSEEIEEANRRKETGARVGMDSDDDSYFSDAKESDSTEAIDEKSVDRSIVDEPENKHEVEVNVSQNGPQNLISSPEPCGLQSLFSDKVSYSMVK